MEYEPVNQLNEREECIVCPSCAAPVGVNEVFCPVCRAPISLLANTDPLQRIYAEGYLYRKAVETKPKLIVVVGIWIIFAPVLLVALFIVISMIFNGMGSGFGGFIFFWIAVALGGFSAVILFRVTKNYIKFEPDKSEGID